MSNNLNSLCMLVPRILVGGKYEVAPNPLNWCVAKVK